MKKPEKKSNVGNIAIGVVLTVAIVGAVVAAVLNAQTNRGEPTTPKLTSRDTDPDLIKYAETGRIATGFKRVGGLALTSAGNVVLAGDEAVAIFAPDGGKIRQFPVAGKPTCVAVDPEDILYVGLSDQLLAYSLEGERQQLLVRLEPQPATNGREQRQPQIMALAADHEAIYVAEGRDRRKVLRYSPEGELLNTIGREIVVYQPTLDVEVAPSGDIWMTNPGQHLVERYTPEGKPVESWGKASRLIEGFSGCCNPTSFALLPDGGFVTAEKNVVRVKVYDTKGRFMCVVAGNEDFYPDDPDGVDVAVNAAGEVFVLDPAQKAVRIYTRKDG